jgi:hypothetical protein
MTRIEQFTIGAIASLIAIILIVMVLVPSLSILSSEPAQQVGRIADKALDVLEAELEADQPIEEADRGEILRRQPDSAPATGTVAAESDDVSSGSDKAVPPSLPFDETPTGTTLRGVIEALGDRITAEQAEDIITRVRELDRIRTVDMRALRNSDVDGRAMTGDDFLERFVELNTTFDEQFDAILRSHIGEDWIGLSAWRRIQLGLLSEEPRRKETEDVSKK